MSSGLASPSACSRTSSRSERVTSAEAGQGTVEAALLLPVVMVVLALLAQPACLLYTRAVMWEAAGEAARVASTAGDMDVCEDYARRRLRAVPEVSPFHVGGTEDWQVSASRSSDGRDVEVAIAGHARPLPLLGNLLGVMAEHDGSGIVLRARVRERIRPDWLEGSYATWMEMWG